MTLQQIHYALTVSRAGSMNRAAEELFISQPALSSTIHSLEEELGITLFIRSKKGVELTAEGADFLMAARQVYQQYELLMDNYGPDKNVRRRFAVSTQHYTFAVRAFVEMVRHFDTSKFEFAIRETKTREVITDIGTMRSEIGVLYRSSYNQKIIDKMLGEYDLIFTPLIRSRAYVYLSAAHPLARQQALGMEQLGEYPYLYFEQDDQSSVYLAEEILHEKEYARTIAVSDRATMLNMINELQGYTLCSGVILDELNNDNCVAIPFAEDAENPNSEMEIGYITKKNSILSEMGERYLTQIRAALKLM